MTRMLTSPARRSVAVCSALLLLALPLGLTISRSAQAQDANGRLHESIYKNLQWRSIGPAIMGGRIDDFAVVENQPGIIYVAAATGGVWKTTNNGTTWEPVFDNEAVSSIGDVAIAPSDPNIVWVGTGEANNRQSSSWGNGVYRSLDGGKTWANMGLKDTHHIGRVVVDPRDPNTVYVAAGGHLWGPNKERGVFKTTDGGKTWANVKFINEDTGFTDITIDPESPMTLYAAAYQRRRTVYGFSGGGPHSGIYKTIDGGATWTKLTNGLPEGDTGRIGLDLYRRDPNIVYAVIENAKGGVFRSEDKGATWKKMSDTNPRPAYYSQIRIDPNNDQRLWVLGANMYVSEDGGKTFQTNVVTRIHSDHHAMWIDPANSNHMLVGNDGGIHFSYDRGRTWEHVNNIPLGQFYEIGFDMRQPYWVCGGLQDNYSWCAPTATLNELGPSNDEWVTIAGGDGFYAQIDPTDPTIIYTESQNGNVSRREMKTGEAKRIRPEPGEGEAPYRFDWNTPILVSPHNSRTIYLGGNRLFKSTDRGDTWTSSPDLSKNQDREKLEIMGAVPDRNTLSRHDGQSTYGHVVTVTESPMREGVLYAGTDDGNLQVSRDGGKTWKNVIDRVPGVAKNAYVSRVVASRNAEGRAYATFDHHRSNDFATYVFVTEDFGETWKSLAGTLPANHPVKVIREHPRNQNLLFVGTEFGAFASFDRGRNWLPLKANLPTVPVYDIAVHPRDNDLILATHGRSLWVLDDITPLEQLSEPVAAEDLHLFDLRPATLYRLYSHKGFIDHKKFIAPNPPYGAIIDYYLKAKPKEEVKITVLDKSGKTVIRELTGPKEAGINRTAWDLRYQPPTPPPPAGQGGGGGGFFGGASRGPRVLPGEYLVKVSVGNQQATKTVRVTEDPRIQLSPAEQEARLQAMLALNKLQKSSDAARRSLQNLRTQLTALQDTLKKQPNVPEAVNSAATALARQVGELQRRVFPSFGGFGGGGEGQQESAGPQDPSFQTAVGIRIGQLFNSLDGYTAPVSPRQLEQIEALSKQLNVVVEQVNKLITEAVPNLNKQMLESGIGVLNAGPRIALP